MSDLNISEIEYHELISQGYNNQRFGIRIKTTPETYKQDFAELIIEVKKRLQMINQNKKEAKK